jgi:DNA uptake protein ComE-like DNA-binding protein
MQMSGEYPMKEYMPLAAMALMMLLAGNVMVQAASINPMKVDGVVNINTATKEELLKLPYVNEDIADNIINARDINGPFSSPDDLLGVKGVNPHLLEILRPYVVVQGKTTIYDEPSGGNH